MLILGGYFHGQQEKGFSILDFALIGIYVLFQSWYTLPMVLMDYFSGDDADKAYNTYIAYLLENKAYMYTGMDGQSISRGMDTGFQFTRDSLFSYFMAPKWFILCFIYARLIINTCHYLNGKFTFEWQGRTIVPFHPLVQIFFWGLFGLTWTDDGGFICDAIQAVTTETIQAHICYSTGLSTFGLSDNWFLWQCVCLCSLMYMISFYYSKDVIDVVIAKAKHAKQWQLKLIGVVAFVLWATLCIFYNQGRKGYAPWGTTLDMFPNWLDNLAVKQDGWEFAFHSGSFGSLADCLVQSFEAILCMMFMSQAPFHLKWWGGATLGAYVNQYVMIYFFFTHMEGWQTIVKIYMTSSYDDNFFYQATVVVIQLSIIFCTLAVYWSLAALVLFQWTLLPFKALELAVTGAKAAMQYFQEPDAADDETAKEKQPLLPVKS
jgi:hypothetical protein